MDTNELNCTLVEKIHNASPIYEQYMDLHAAYNAQKEMPVIPIGYKRNNDFCIIPGINVIAGMTGHGKSMFGNSLAFRAVEDGLNVLYISLEISKENIFYQLLSIYSLLFHPKKDEQISHSKIKKRLLTPKEEEFVFNQLWEEFKNLKGNLHILTEWDFDPSSSLSLQLKMKEVEEYSVKQSGKGIDLVIVDYIQLFKQFKETGSNSEFTALNNWVNIFRMLSLNYLGRKKEIPIILISQLNRDAWNDEKNKIFATQKNNCISEMNLENKKNYIPGVDKKQPKGKKKVFVPPFIPTLSQIAGSTEIVKAARQVFVIASDESSKVSKQCFFQVLKNRDGETRVEPCVMFMDPEFYFIGSFPVEEKRFEGSLADIFGKDFQLSDLTSLNLEDFPGGNL